MVKSSSPLSRGPSIPAARVAFLLLLGLSAPATASAQFGALEALARNVTDLSFFGGFGGLAPTVGKMAPDERTFGYGVELLFQISTVDRPIPGAATPAASDSVRLTWSRMEVVRSDEGVDTLLYYDVEAVPPLPPPSETIWTMEMGIGYGQVSGFALADPNLQLRGSIRDLPAATVYATYEPWSTYFGLRTGFMKTRGLQVVDKATGDRYSGDSEAFLAGALMGYAWGLGDFWAFTEAAYTIRYFPSVQWSDDGLPDGIPTELHVSGWSVSVGIQFPIK